MGRSVTESRNLTIPAATRLGKCDWIVQEFFERVAKHKGFKNAKTYLKKEFGLSGNAYKNMIFPKSCSRVIILYNQCKNEVTKKKLIEYRRVLKLPRDNYANIMSTIGKEVSKLPAEKRSDLDKITMKHIGECRLAPESYQQVLYQRLYYGYEVIKNDEETANLINIGLDAKDACEKIIAALPKNEDMVK